MGGWWGEYSFKCQPVDYSDSATATRVSAVKGRQQEKERKRGRRRNTRRGISYNKTKLLFLSTTTTTIKQRHQAHSLQPPQRVPSSNPEPLGGLKLYDELEQLPIEDSREPLLNIIIIYYLTELCGVVKNGEAGHSLLGR